MYGALTRARGMEREMRAVRFKKEG